MLQGLQKQNKTLNSLTSGEWQAIHAAAQDLDRQILEVRYIYMKKRERMKFMLEPNGQGGLPYVGGRTAFTGRSKFQQRSNAKPPL